MMFTDHLRLTLRARKLVSLREPGFETTALNTRCDVSTFKTIRVWKCNPGKLTPHVSKRKQRQLPCLSGTL